MIELTRIKSLNNKAIRKNGCVIYWMQASQREEFNHALEYGIQKANELNKPFYVYFGLTASYPGANLRHYSFMLEGLKETANALNKRGISFVIQKEEPVKGIINASDKACLVITDRGYTKIQKQWRRDAAKALDCLLIQIESDVIVPVEIASPKEDYAASTIRRKISGQLLTYLKPLKREKLLSKSPALKGIDLSDINKALASFSCDKSVGKAIGFTGGSPQAKSLLKSFIKNKIKKYAEFRSDPSLDYESKMSPYLHFGQISSLYIALEVLKSGEKINCSFLEELIIRRELAVNFVHYNSSYDSIACLPKWAKQTITDHESDTRPYIYNLKELEEAKTHDPYWNAAQTQMTITGKMHNYMRMYWGKKVIEWSKTAEQAYKTLIYLNDKYELDGRDPNGYAGIAWCFGKHDRAWTERNVFGKIRYMNAKGLEIKFYIKEYVKQQSKLV
ncbi:MAG: deoxyribodipyrimidine photo-lyase [bacterium]